MTIFINPGSGPVSDATEADAIKCAEQMIDDLATIQPRYRGERLIENATFRRNSVTDERGRFGFVFSFDGRDVEVGIPGLPIDRVRYLGHEGQNIWHFPRLYVDGSSWVWEFAIGAIREQLVPAQEEG